jgi:hypothetical protein
MHPSFGFPVVRHLRQSPTLRTLPALPVPACRCLMSQDIGDVASFLGRVPRGRPLPTQVTPGAGRMCSARPRLIDGDDDRVAGLVTVADNEDLLKATSRID